MDDDDLYGDAPIPTSVPQPISHEKTQLSSNGSNGVVAHLEAKAEEDLFPDEEEEQEEEEEESDEDVEIIMEQTSRSLDFRQNPPTRPPVNRNASAAQAPRVPQQPSSLTTEYTTLQRGAPIKAVVPPSTTATPPVTTSTPQVAAQPSISAVASPTSANEPKTEEGPDPSTLPPATAPPSHPTIDPSIAGTLDGRSILDVDLGAMADKPWRRPGSDISDWFNYGFDEISWEAYCYRRRDLGELGNILKVNVMNFAGMPEDQMSALPPELRTMVMTGATAMMNGGGPNPNMMAGMNPMMDMSGMGGMNMGQMGMGMNGDMQMQMQQGGPMMPEGQGQGPSEQGQMAMPDGYAQGPNGQGMMGMNMGGEYAMQQDPNQMGQQMYPGGMEGSGTPVSGAGRGATPVPFRGGRGAMPRGRGAVRGRGRGAYAGGADSVAPARPASPLPPGVPTGPRNQNKYKDRDNNAPAVDGLDYGGTNKDSGGGRTPSGEPEDRSSSRRKRRSSPGLDDGRGSKRR
ncbi:Fip1-domain-containing protein [Athelia psychrophila]|uniref:Fip1-domain-containing protein n=1 Tax=Athelia psychrophila TaxID=1759441 RepID=A0A166S1K9_9AGAM|nr:Fip1-domain-containing protein [Fibularhizoctonia sp. CBS 109695]